MSNLIPFLALKKFKFVRLSGSPPDVKYLEYYDAAYDCWKKVWIEAFRGLGISKPFVSDEFTRQEEILTIFYGQQCVGMMFFRIVDLSIYAYQNDTYFKLWTLQDLKNLAEHGPLIAVMSNMTISTDWRKTSYDLSMKDLVVYYTCQRFKDSQTHGMATFTRNSKNVNKLAERFGGICIRSNIENYGPRDLVNLFKFTQESVTEGEFDNVKTLGRFLYKNEIIAQAAPLHTKRKSA